MNTENFNVDLNKVVLFLLQEIAVLQSQVLEANALASALWSLVYPDEFEAARDAVASSGLQRPELLLKGLLERLSLESNDMAEMLKGLLEKC